MLKSDIKIMIIVFFLILAGRFFSTAAQVNPIFKSADELFQEGAYSSAIAEYKRGLYYSSENTDNLQAYYQIGQCYLKLAKYVKARQSWMTALAQSPDSLLGTNAFKGIVKSYILEEQYSLAETELLQARNRGGVNPAEIEYLHGLNYLAWGRWKKAKSRFNRILKDPQFFKTVELENRVNQGVRLPLKNSYLAGFCSAILPGSGQIYAGEYFNGVVAFILNTSLICLTAKLFSDRYWISGSVAGLYAYGIWKTNFKNACKFAAEYNKSITDEYLSPILNDEW